MKRLGFALYLLACVCLAAALAEGIVRLTNWRPPGYLAPRFFPGLAGDMEPHARYLDVLYPAVPHRVTATAQGTRGTREFTPQKPPGVLRVLCVGDSFTFGHGVDDKDTYPEFLFQELSRRYPDARFEVINAGMPLFGILDELDYYLEKGVGLDADLVVLEYFANDIQDMTRPAVFRRQHRMDPARATRPALSRWLSWSRVYQVAVSLGQKATKTTIFAHPSQATPGDDQVGQPDGFPGFTASKAEEDFCSNPGVFDPEAPKALNRVFTAYGQGLAAFKKAVEARGARFLFVRVPDHKETFEFADQPGRSMDAVTAASGAAQVDLLAPMRQALFERESNPYLLPRDGHLSPAGNALMARCVADAVRVAQDAQGRPVLSLTADSCPTPGTRVGTVRLVPDDGAGLRAVAADGARISHAERANLRFEEMFSPAMRILRRDPDQTAPGAIVLRVEADRPVSGASLWLSAMQGNDPAGDSAVTVWFSRDERTWERALRRTSDRSGRPEGFETMAVADMPFPSGTLTAFSIRIELAGNAALYAEPAPAPDSRRKIELTLTR